LHHSHHKFDPYDQGQKVGAGPVPKCTLLVTMDGVVLVVAHPFTPWHV
jgi:hypothetical protein